MGLLRPLIFSILPYILVDSRDQSLYEKLHKSVNVVEGVNLVLEHPFFPYFSGFAQMSLFCYTSLEEYIHMLEISLVNSSLPYEHLFDACQRALAPLVILN